MVKINDNDYGRFSFLTLASPAESILILSGVWKLIPGLCSWLVLHSDVDGMMVLVASRSSLWCNLMICSRNSPCLGGASNLAKV